MRSLSSFKSAIRIAGFCIVLVFAAGDACASQESLPWYKKLWSRLKIKDDKGEVARSEPESDGPQAAKAPAVDPPAEMLPAEEDDGEYSGPDLSEEKTIEDGLLRREFPVPAKPHAQPPRVPPSADQYTVPEAHD